MIRNVSGALREVALREVALREVAVDEVAVDEPLERARRRGGGAFRRGGEGDGAPPSG
ncbi:hypothetical protein [Streptomyces asiaticus]